uniref:Phage uncharacterized protein (Putative large terminase), C-terminal domain-containing protein n=1 Tax=Candidatus Kentrum sp. LPFa TaxID=2126335 RepID=A0A450XMY3_9GAMM|nr:MAG: phage uncharacterized protein (putative large terminase), C-terminal domain-containing protein [Candidatus Kentron sp. LPFa]
MTNHNSLINNVPTTNHQILTKQILKDQKLRQALASKSHFYFFHIYFSHYITYETAPFQKEMFALTEAEKNQNIIIVAFRGSGKSTIVNLSYPIWAILGKQQKKFVLLIGQTQHQAQQHLKNLKRELEVNDILKQDLGPFEECDDWNVSSLLLKDYDARITAVSIEQSVRGLRHNQYRPDLIICDDVEDMASVKTREGRDKTYNWLTGEVIPAGSQKTRVIMIGNLLHEDSLLMRMKEKIRKKEMQGVCKAYPIINSRNKIFWPSKYSSMKKIKDEEKRIGNKIAWEREFKLRIVAEEGRLIDKETIQYYDELPQSNDLPQDQGGISLSQHCLGIDLAISQKDSADYTAIVPAKVYLIGDKYFIYILPNIVNKRLTFSGAQTEVKTLAQIIHDSSPKSVYIYVEAVGYQAAFYQELKNSDYHAIETPVKGDKHSRLSAASHYIKAGKVLFPKKGAERLIEQMTGFGIEKHDDMVDAFTLLVNHVMANPPKRFFLEYID